MVMQEMAQEAMAVVGLIVLELQTLVAVVLLTLAVQVL
jgi:hypothetical protein